MAAGGDGMAMVKREAGTASAPGATPRAVAGVLGVVAAAGGLAGVLVVLTGAVGWGLTARSLLAVGALAVVYGGLVALAVPRAGGGVRIVLSVVLGLATAGIAVWISGLFEWFLLRWVVVAAGGLAWLHPSARAIWRSDVKRVDWRRRAQREGPVLWGLAVAWALAARSLAGYYAPVDGTGTWRSFYVDIPWHIALTAETLDRAPTVYPWIPDVPIGYSWLFFGTLGLLGNLTGATAAQLVLMIGPACLAVLVPAVLAACTWVVSRSRTAVVIAPVLFELTRAPVFGHTEALQLTAQWVLINRDSTNAMVLSVVALLVLGLRDGAGRWRPGMGVRCPGRALLLALFLITFAVAGSRGGAVLPLLGAAGLSWLVAMLRGRENRLTATWSLVVVGGAVLGATVGVTRSSGSFRLDPLSFLPSEVVGGTEVPVAALASLAVMLAMTAAMVSAGRWSPPVRPALPALTGAAVAGVLGAALFGHPSFSQLYFFHAAWPAIVVGLAVLIAVAFRRLGPLVALVLAVAVLAVQVVLRPPALLPPTPWPVRMTLAAAVALLVVGGVTTVLARSHGWRSTAAVTLPVLTAALQPWTLPEVVTPSAVVEPAETPATVSDGQLAVLSELRSRSSAEDLVATNKHCINGSVAGGDCDARWFTVAAFAERRVLVEGWSYDYTWSSSGTDNHEPYWDPDLLWANDDFIAAPSGTTCRILWSEGVRWIYVDKREPWSPRIGEHADPVRATEDAALYRLGGACP